MGDKTYLSTKVVSGRVAGRPACSWGEGLIAHPHQSVILPAYHRVNVRQPYTAVTSTSQTELTYQLQINVTI